MTAKHTPTPWARNKSPSDTLRIFSGHYQIGEVRNCNGCPQNEANADFIVRAVNAHSDLVAALEGVLPLAEAYADGKTGSHPDHEWIEVARAALAKAEA